MAFVRTGPSVLLLFLVIFFPYKCAAVSETHLRGGLAGEIDNYFQNAGQSGVLTVAENITISYRRFDENCGNTALVIVPGWSEPKEKYAELIYDLKSLDYCLYIYDHRSQGSSSRLLKNTQITYVDSFQDYVHDLQQFDEIIVRSKQHQRIFILAHSMGGLIATEYAAQKPQEFSGLILSTPMFQPDTGALPESAAYWITSLLINFGYANSFVPSHGEWQAKTFAENQQTNSEVRFARSEQLFLDNPSLIVSGVSNQWLYSAIETSRQTSDYAQKMNIPIRLFQATEDSFVRPERQDEFCALAPECELISVENAKHEILMENDAVRNFVIEHIISFISNHAVP